MQNSLENIDFVAKFIAKNGPSPTFGATFEVRPDGIGIGTNFDHPMFFVYILENPTGRFYIGQTGDLQARLKSHNRRDVIGGKYTRKNGPWLLVWSEPHPTRSAAMQREQQIKQMKSSRWIRENLLNGRVPMRRD